MVLRGYDTGLATAYEIERALSRDAVRRSARVTRPSLSRPHRAPAAEVGIRLGRRAALGRRPSRRGRGPGSNPAGLAAIPSTVRWSPLAGCAQRATAMERAGYLLRGAAAPGSDQAFWEGSSYRLLRCLLFAAAVAGRSMA